MSGAIVSLFNTPWLGNVLGIGGIVVGALLAWYFYKKAKPVARLRQSLGDTPLIDTSTHDNPDELMLLFRGEAVPRVTSTSYGLWNDGTTTFRSSDIVEQDALRLVAKDARILSVSTERTSRTAIGASIIQIDPTTAQIRFDFLDPGDGFRVRVLHTGAAGAVSNHGVIVGLPDGIAGFDADRGLLTVMRVVGIVMVLTMVIVSAPIAVLVWQIMIHGSMTSRINLGIFSAFLVLAGYWSWKQEEVSPGPRRFKNVPLAVSEDTALLRGMFSPPKRNLTEGVTDA